MSQQNSVLDKTFKADLDLSAKQYYAVKMSGDATPYAVMLGASNADKVIGILQNEPNFEEAAVVRMLGTTKAVAGTPLAVGVDVCTHTDGRLDLADANNDFVIGITLEQAAAAGDIIEILITHNYLGK